MARITRLDTSKGKSYNLNHIEHFVGKNSNLEIEEVGGDNIGDSFIIIRNNDSDSVISAVMTGYSGAHGAIYEIVYSDIESIGFDADKNDEEE